MKWQREAVEALVYPLPLREALKEQLREELWGHLASLYEEERARGGATVEARLVRLLGSETASGVAVFRSYGKASLLFLLVALASVGLPGMTLATALVSWTTVSMLLVLVFTAGWLLFREARMARTALNPPVTLRIRSAMVVRRLAIATATGVAMAMLAWMAGYALSFVLCSALQRNDLLYVVELFGGQVLVRATLLPPIGAGLGWLFVWREHRARALHDWPYGDLPESEA